MGVLKPRQAFFLLTVLCGDRAQNVVFEVKIKVQRNGQEKDRFFLRKKVSFLLGVFNNEDKGLRPKLIYQNLRLFTLYNMQKSY